jgi:hypothetical protein
MPNGGGRRTPARACVEPCEGTKIPHKSVGQVAENLHKPDRCRMSSIIRDGDTFRGISVFGRGVFTTKDGRWTYAGQHRDGYACGLGVLTRSDGSKIYSEHGPDGKYDGRCLGRFTNGNTGHWLSERGEETDPAFVFADGTCRYNDEDCAPDDPRLLARIAQVAPVEVRPIDPAPAPTHTKQSSDAPAWFVPAGAGDRRGHRGAPLRCTSPRTSHAATVGCTPIPYRAPAVRPRHSVRFLEARRTRPSPRSVPPRVSPTPKLGPLGTLAGRCSFAIPFRFGHAEEAVANLPLRLAVRVHCGHQACTARRVYPPGYSSGTKAEGTPGAQWVP